MCGRFVCVSSPEEIAAYFGIESIQMESKANYNIAPTQSVAAIVHSFKYQTKALVELQWGLIPVWAKDPKIASKLINARSETLAEKPSFRRAFKNRRCLIVADGFYEWQKTADKQKQPVYIRLKSEKPFVFAGLYEGWKDPAGQRHYTCTIITTQANSLLSSIHHRMPVILGAEYHDLWLDPSFQDTQALSDLLQAYPEDEMEYYPISTRVNKVANNSSECILPVEN